MDTVKKNKVRYDYNYLKSYCDDNNIELLKDYINEKVTRDTIIEAKCKCDDCDGFAKKNFRMFITFGCFCKKCTLLFENIKKNKTNFENFGFENPSQSQVIKDKKKQTCLKNHGVEYPFQSQYIKNKSKKTSFQLYGTQHPFQCQKIKDKTKKTCLQKYGVENPLQHPEIAEKQSKNSYKRKLYQFPSGKTEYIQGYENTALDELLNSGVEEHDICVGCKNVPEIWYEDETTKKHRHFVDIFIKSQNKCIEVKSTWTAEKKKDRIFLKQQAAKKLGYDYEIWVYNNKREKVECHK